MNEESFKPVEIGNDCRTVAHVPENLDSLAGVGAGVVERASV